MTWNFDMAAAPKTAKVILASKCGKVIRSNWIEKEQRWNSFAAKEQPIAWQLWPEHPSATDEFGDL
jgi:hypothetical protein